MIYPGDNQIYNFPTGEWSVYDVSVSKPVISLDKKDKTSFKTDTLDVAITVTNADSAQYKVDNGEWVAFSNITTATVGKDTAINAYTTLTVSATNANGTETAAYQYLKKDPNAPVGTDGSTTPALTGKYSTNPNNQYGVRKTISVDGDKSDWIDFYELGHDSKLDMFYEMSVPLEKLGISASDIETNGIGIMKISTFGTSGMDSLPYDPSMSDNADKAYSQQEPNSQEKEDEDSITVPFARIGKALSGSNTDPTSPTTTTPVPTEPTPEPTTAPATVILGDANGDNLITIADATLIQKYIVGINTGYNIGSAI